MEEKNRVVMSWCWTSGDSWGHMVEVRVNGGLIMMMDDWIISKGNNNNIMGGKTDAVPTVSLTTH